MVEISKIVASPPLSGDNAFWLIGMKVAVRRGEKAIWADWWVGWKREKKNCLITFELAGGEECTVNKGTDARSVQNPAIIMSACWVEKAWEEGCQFQTLLQPINDICCHFPHCTSQNWPNWMGQSGAETASSTQVAFDYILEHASKRGKVMDSRYIQNSVTG